MEHLGDIARLGAKKYGGKDAIVFENERLSYRELNERINRLANALVHRGCQVGDRLAIMAKNSHHYLEVYLAAAKIGMSVVPLNFLLRDEALSQIIADSEAVILFAGDGYTGRCARMKHALDNVRDWISLERRCAGFDYYEALLDSATAEEPEISVDPESMCVLAYTNGTTAPPKGVMLAHKNVLASATSTIDLMQFHRFDTGCFVQPFFKTEIFTAFSLLMVGGKVAINRQVDRREILRLLQDEKCTYIHMAPALYDWLQQDPEFDDYDLTSLRVMLYSGSTFAQEKLISCVKRFWKPFAQTYGVTETSGCSVTALMSDDHILEGPGSQRLASAGKPVAGVDVRIVDSDENPVQPGKIGELAVKSQNVMMGYWKEPQLTQEILTNGWLHTGDLGYVDSDGYVYITGHKPPQSQAADSLHFTNPTGRASGFATPAEAIEPHVNVN